MGGGKSGGVDLYVGGTEHAVLHLLYARFWHKVLFDLGTSHAGAFQRWSTRADPWRGRQKMSKSRGNVVNPDDVIAAYGATASAATKCSWARSSRRSRGRCRRRRRSPFPARVWRLVMEENQAGEWV
jgi:leucyl-tRNA synthetase